MTDVYLNDYQKLLSQVKFELSASPELYDKLSAYIEELEKRHQTAQNQYIVTFNRLEKADYEINNLKTANEHIGSTLKLSEIENKALKEFARASGQLLAVTYGDV